MHPVMPIVACEGTTACFLAFTLATGDRSVPTVCFAHCRPDGEGHGARTHAYDQVGTSRHYSNLCTVKLTCRSASCVRQLAFYEAVGIDTLHAHVALFRCQDAGLLLTCSCFCSSRVQAATKRRAPDVAVPALRTNITPLCLHRRVLEEQLRRLGRQSVDFWVLRGFSEPQVSVEETMAVVKVSAMSMLRLERTGALRHPWRERH